MNSCKTFSPSCSLWKHFPCKNLSRCLRSGSQLVRGQANMEYEAKLCSSICSISEMLFVQHAVGHRCREIGPFLLTNVGCRYCSFWCTLWICWAYFSDVLVLLGFRKGQSISSSPSNSDHDLCLVQIWLCEVFWSFLVQSLSWSLKIVIYNPLYVAHHSPIKKWFIV